jgi:hypothetical protein
MILGSQTAVSAADGATTDRRIRINRPDDLIARCEGSREPDQRKDCAGRQKAGDGKLSARPGVSSGFFEQGVFDEANRRRDDRAGYAAAGCVAKRRADVDPAGRRTAKGGDQALQDSSTNTSAHGARYRFEEGAQDNILEKAADGISANRPAHDLDNEVDYRSGHFYLPFWPSGSNDAGSPRPID